jgi:hypothetical protein
VIDNIDAMRAEVEAALHAAIAERAELLAAHQGAARAAHDAQHRFENVQLRVARATRHGQDEVTGAVLQLVANERRRRDQSAAAATLAKRKLENCDWIISCKRAELAQLELLARPDPDRGPVREVVKRPPPPGLDAGDDSIVWPAGRKDAVA